MARGSQRPIEAPVLLRSARLSEVELDLVEPFETSFGVEHHRRFLLVELESRDGRTGWGECVAQTEPLYSSETVSTAQAILREQLLPILINTSEWTPSRFTQAVKRLRGHRMAKAAVEMALIDLAAQEQGRPIGRWLGGRRSRVEVGVSVGIPASVPALAVRVGRYLDEGYRRIKIKVRPGWDVLPLRALRRLYPDVELWVDANQSYPSTAVEGIRRWATRFDVAQVEQPFAERAIRLHARLARGAPFRVCLDESIVDAASLEDALDAQALQSLNVKVGRVGGMLLGRDLARRARRSGVPAWVGGMLESGIGRAHNVHLASLNEFSLPGDLSANDRYYPEDLTDPPFRLGPGSTLAVPTGPGLGVEVVERVLRRARRAVWTFRPSSGRGDAIAPARTRSAGTRVPRR